MYTFLRNRFPPLAADAVAALWYALLAAIVYAYATVQPSEFRYLAGGP